MSKDEIFQVFEGTSTLRSPRALEKWMDETVFLNEEEAEDRASHPNKMLKTGRGPLNSVVYSSNDGDKGSCHDDKTQPC